MRTLVLTLLVLSSCRHVEQEVSPPAVPPGEARLVRTATVALEVSDMPEAVDEIARVVERHGGYVQDANVWREGELLRGVMTLRVPAGELPQTLEAIRRLSIRIHSETVTIHRRSPGE